jgi:hypothetical protein
MWWHRWIPASARRGVAALSPATGLAVRRRISQLQQRSGALTGRSCDPRFEFPPSERPDDMVAKLSHILSINLAALARQLHPDVAVIDGFTGLEGEGSTAAIR